MAEERIGVDESGKGDFFGPLVIAACYVGPEHYAELEGVMDSKKLTDKRALALSGVIKRTCPHAIVAIGPAKYNELYAKIKNLYIQGKEVKNRDALANPESLDQYRGLV